MAPTDLPPELIAAGRRLLEATDELGLDAQGAAWVWEADLEEWRYYLVTVLTDTMGPSWVYKRLLKAFNKMPVREDFLAVDVHLGSPNEVLFMLISGFEKADDVGPVTIKNISRLERIIDGKRYGKRDVNLVMYRMQRVPPSRMVDASRRRFERKVRELTLA